MDAEIEPEIAEYPEAGPYWVGLWAVARHWVAGLEQMFEPNLVATTGITRRFAVRCRKWLWSIEGLVRRLIIAAAMKLPAKLDASQLAALTRRTHKPSKPSRPASPSVSFIVLPRLPGRQAHAQKTPRPSKPPPEHRHLVFPGDDLLQLFGRRDRGNTRPASRRFLNPLQRRGRRSPWDPDYQDDPEKAEDASRRYWLYGPDANRMGNPLTPARDREPRPRTRVDRSSPYWRPLGGDGPEWKRLEQEWERIIPAPRLAARIKALVRVMQKPERWVERIARKLDAERDLLSKIRTLPSPRLRKPRLDRGPIPPLEAELAQSHAFIDTS